MEPRQAYEMRTVDKALQRLLAKLLNDDPVERLTAAELLKDKWLKGKKKDKKNKKEKKDKGEKKKKKDKKEEG